MDFSRILKESVKTVKDNFIIIVPNVAVSIIITLLSLLLLNGGIASDGGIASIEGMEGIEIPNPEAPTDGADGLMGILLVLGIISTVIGTISHGVVIAMAKEAIVTGKTSINSGINSALGKIEHLIVAAFLISIIVIIGTVLFVLPGLIAAFLLMFTLVGIMVSNLSAIEAMKKSFEIVKTNLKDSAVLFLMIVVIGLVFAITSSIFNAIPIIGRLMGIVSMGIFWAYTSVVLVKTYKEMSK